MRSLRIVLAVAGLVTAIGLLALRLGAGRAPGAPPRSHAASPEAASVPEPSPTIDVSRLRDVFRYADERSEAPAPGERPWKEPPPQATPPEAAGPRLVGVVRRSGRLLAALADGGEVEVAGPGESAAGVTVLLVEEDAVRVRLPDGTERTLRPTE